MADGGNVLAFDVGATLIRYGVFSAGSSPIPRTIATPTDRAESFYQTLARVAEQQTVPLDGIAISMPGFIDTERRRAITAGPLAILNKKEIGAELTEHLGRAMPIWVENDANCVAIAEKRSGNARTLDDFVVITIDNGIGGAVFVDGRIRRGRDWNAGELGMMVTDYGTSGPRPLHDFASVAALAERYAAEYGVPVEGVVPTTLLRRLDEPRIRDIVERWADYVAVAIYNVVVVLDPECVLLGGQISHEPTLLPLVREALNRIPTWKDFRTPVKRCRHSGIACLLGAYYAFMDEVAAR